MVLLPIAFGFAILALLSILRQERHRRESGLPAHRSALVTLVLATFALLAVAYFTIYLAGTLTA